MVVIEDLSAKLGALSAISTMVAPRDHMSTVVLYVSPNISSGVKNVVPTVLRLFGCLRVSYTTGGFTGTLNPKPPSFTPLVLERNMDSALISLWIMFWTWTQSGT